MNAITPEQAAQIERPRIEADEAFLDLPFVAEDIGRVLHWYIFDEVRRFGPAEQRELGRAYAPGLVAYLRGKEQGELNSTLTRVVADMVKGGQWGDLEEAFVNFLGERLASHSGAMEI